MLCRGNFCNMFLWVKLEFLIHKRIMIVCIGFTKFHAIFTCFSHFVILYIWCWCSHDIVIVRFVAGQIATKFPISSPVYLSMDIFNFVALLFALHKSLVIIHFHFLLIAQQHSYANWTRWRERFLKRHKDQKKTIVETILLGLR